MYNVVQCGTVWYSVVLCELCEVGGTVPYSAIQCEQDGTVSDDTQGRGVQKVTACTRSRRAQGHSVHKVTAYTRLQGHGTERMRSRHTSYSV